MKPSMLVRSPRVGDGLLRLGKAGRVIYASPNAQSAYRRLGLAADLIGAELGVVTTALVASDEPLDESLMVVAAGRAPREAEVDGNGSVVQLRSIPLIVGGSRTGALVLVRDVTELRHRERELMTKDATIREIHHRVKNNLQTVAALLRLQARRLRAPEARAALDEAIRRVGSIAVVHETLSHAPEEVVDFDDIADRVARMAGEVSAAEVGVIPKITGSFGQLSAAVATPLAMTPRQRLELFVPVCQAIQHAHQKGIIHRDIKPSNILVTLHDGVPVPKVIDFGIAKATEGRLTDNTVYTQLHQFIGTPAYMPETRAFLRVERRAAGQQFVEQHTQAVDVAARIDVQPAHLRLLGAHVSRRADKLMHLRVNGRVGQPAFRRLGDAKVYHLRHRRPLVQ